MSDIADWFPVLADAVKDVLVGDYDKAASRLKIDPDAAPPGDPPPMKDAEVIEVREVRDTEPAPKQDEPKTVLAEGCGRTFNRGQLVCVEHDDAGDCVLMKVKQP